VSGEWIWNLVIRSLSCGMLDPLLDLPSAVPIQTDTKGIKEALTCVEKKKAMRIIPEIIRATTQENHVQTTFCLGACWLCA